MLILLGHPIVRKKITSKFYFKRNFKILFLDNSCKSMSVLQLPLLYYLFAFNSSGNNDLPSYNSYL